MMEVFQDLEENGCAGDNDSARRGPIPTIFRRPARSRVESCKKLPDLAGARLARRSACSRWVRGNSLTALTTAAAEAEVATARSNFSLRCLLVNDSSFSSMYWFIRWSSSAFGGSLFRNNSVSRTAPSGFETASMSCTPGRRSAPYFHRLRR